MIWERSIFASSILSGIVALCFGVCSLGCGSGKNQRTWLIGATTAAGVTSAHNLGYGTVEYVDVPCGESRFIGYSGPSGLGGLSGTSRQLHRITVDAQAEPIPATLQVRVTASDGVAIHEQSFAISKTEDEWQSLDVRIDAGRPAPTNFFIVELHAEGTCRKVLLNLSMHQPPISGP